MKVASFQGVSVVIPCTCIFRFVFLCDSIWSSIRRAKEFPTNLLKITGFSYYWSQVHSMYAIFPLFFLHEWLKCMVSDVCKCRYKYNVCVAMELPIQSQKKLASNSRCLRLAKISPRGHQLKRCMNVKLYSLWCCVNHAHKYAPVSMV